MYITKNVLADILPMCVDGVNGTFSLIPIPQMGTLVVAGVHHGLQIDIAGALEVADAEGVLAQQLTPGRVLSTCRSLKQGLAFSMAITWAGMSSSLRQGLGLEPEQPFEAGTQLVLVEDLLDGGAGHGDAAQQSWALIQTPPRVGYWLATARIWSTTSGGVVARWLWWMGGRSLRPARLWVWKRRLDS